MAQFDINHFFETRQEIASEMGTMEAQRRVAEIRQAIAAKRIEEEQAKAAAKAATKADEKKGGNK